MNFTFIHVNFNNTQKTIDCCASILRNNTKEYAIIIVDNNSSANEREKLIRWYEGENPSIITLQLLSENIGYFPALNYGLTHCVKRFESDYIIIGNNDLVFEDSFLLKLSKRHYENNTYIISPNVVNIDNNHQNPQVKYRYTKLQLLFLDLYFFHYWIAALLGFVSRFIKFRGIQKSKDDYQNSQYISIGYGACYILTKSYIQYVGEIPSYLFLMNEENALSDIVFKHNGRIYYDADLIVHHMEHSSVNMVPPKKLYKYAQISYCESKKHFSNANLYDKYL
jgi:GT2 family glycosyltransferase